jgi:hypothetical protein
MLNELLAIEHGLVAAGIQVAAPHPDVKEVGKADVLRVRLATDSGIQAVESIPPEARLQLWTLRDGQQNSFPYVKITRPILSVPLDKAWAEEHYKLWKTLTSEARRTELRRLRQEHAPNVAWMKSWPGEALKKRIAERIVQLGPLREGDADAVPAAFERFLAASHVRAF